MQEPYLEITFRRGRPLAAYYYLPRRRSQRSHKTVRAATGMLVDYSRDGRPIGLEIQEEFRRKQNNPTLHAHKGQGGYGNCPGRCGYLVRTT